MVKFIFDTGLGSKISALAVHSLRGRTFLAFSVILLLTISLCAVAIFNFRQATGAFQSYEHLAGVTAGSQTIATDLLQADVAVATFLGGDRSAADAAAAAMAAARRRLGDDDERAEAIDRWQQEFLDLAKLTAERDQLVSERLDPPILVMQRTTAILLSALQAVGAEGRFVLAEADFNQRLTAMRYTAKWYFANGDEVAHQLAEQALQGALNLNQKLTNDPALAAFKARHEALGKQLQDWQADFARAIDLFGTTRDMVADHLAPDGQKAKKNVDDRLQAARQEQDSLGPKERAAIAEASRLLIALVGIAIATGAAVVIAIGRTVTAPIERMAEAMVKLTNGDLTVTVSDASGIDELAKMTRALAVFRDTASESARLRDEADRERQRASVARREARLALAADLEGTVATVVGSVTAAATEMQDAANTLTLMAENSRSRAEAAQTGASAAAHSVEAVAAAAAQLSGSIAEISRRVDSSARLAMAAVADAQEAAETTEQLSTAATHIGGAVRLIHSVAAQTNLLALNATIEAARAGEAGKGFAVVANEVKTLAGQTGKATDEISNQVDAVQKATGRAVEDLSSIRGRIDEIHQLATAISARVEEQNTATAAIAHSVQQVATGTAQVTSNIAEVGQTIGHAGAAAARVLSAAEALSGEAARLDREVQRFLTQIRE